MDIGLKEIRQWHLARGFVDVGYHYIIRRDGSIEEGRPLMASGAHARGYNHNSIGVCMVGGKSRSGKPEANFTDAQWSSLDDLTNEIQEDFTGIKIIGHNEISSKACPTFDVQEWLSQL